MSQPNPQQPPKVSLEDLLRLKRHERPAPEFWVRFDRELQQKVWRTLLEPAAAPARVWWVRGVAWFTAGATAVLVVGLSWYGGFSSQAHAPTAMASLVSPSRMGEPKTASAPAIDSTGATTDQAAGVNTVALAQPAPVVESLSSTATAATVHKMAATVAFDDVHSDGVRYAADTLVDRTMTVPARGNAF
jgi:hypothetical protein